MRKTLASVWLVLRMSAKVSPRETVIACVEVLGTAIQVLQPLFLALFVGGIIERDLTRVVGAVLAFGATFGLGLTLQLWGNTARINQRERVGFAFDSEIARMTAGIPTLDHLESATYLDELQALRDQQGALGDALNMVLNVGRMLVMAGGTILLAATADWQLLFLAAAGVVNLLTTRWRIRWQTAAEKESTEPGRLSTHLVEVTTTSAGAAELRVFGIAQVLRDRLSASVRAWRAPDVRVGIRNGWLDVATTVVFYAVVIAVLVSMVRGVIGGTIGIPAVVLALVLVTQLQTVGEMVHWAMLNLTRTARTADRFRWLRDYEAQVREVHCGRAEPPPQLRHGIRTVNLTYAYPGAESPTLDGVTLDLPAGAVVALVGENGAGKSTLVNLLAGMYRPTDGRVLVDGTDLASIDLTAWRARMTGAFQDYAKFEFTAQKAVGVGQLEHLDDSAHVHRALRAGAGEDVLTALPDGLGTRLGTAWPDGVELSGGQWQRLGIARGMMREDPLLLVLDEPTAALDAATEHALFERYAAAAREAGGRGAVTLLVTHRFSTVAAADLVVVLDRGKVVEVGTHAELVERDGHYAELYELQARGYR